MELVELLYDRFVSLVAKYKWIRDNFPYQLYHLYIQPASPVQCMLVT